MNEKKSTAPSDLEVPRPSKAQPKAEPAADGATLLSELRNALTKQGHPTASQLVRILQATTSSCNPTDAELQEVVDLLTQLPPDTRIDLYVRLERGYPAKTAPRSVLSRTVDALRTSNSQRTEWLAEPGVRLLSQSGPVDPRRHLQVREQFRAALSDESRWGDVLPDLAFRLARKEKEAPLLLFGLFVAEALAEPPNVNDVGLGAPVVDALSVLFTGLLKSKGRAVQPALDVACALVRQAERESEAGDAVAMRTAANERRARELEHARDGLEEEREAQGKQIDALRADVASRDRQIAALEQRVTDEQSRYQLLDDASRSARLDALRGLIARLRRTMQHEIGDLIEAVGEPRDGRDRLIRARAQNVLQLLADEAGKVEGQ